MDSLDTNVLVRYYTNDDPIQSPMSARLIEERGPLLVPVTVVLELVWVLDSHCELPKSNIAAVLRHLLALPAFHVQHHEALGAALTHYQSGLEFEDALHFTLSRDCQTFWTFDDRGLARKANRLGLQPACRIPA